MKSVFPICLLMAGVPGGTGLLPFNLSPIGSSVDFTLELWTETSGHPWQMGSSLSLFSWGKLSLLLDAS